MKSKIALVTGSGRGIGKAIALALAKGGMDVVVNARHLPEIEATATEIEALGQKSMAIQCDVSDYEAVKEMVQHIVTEWGGIDVLVNNAGTGSVRASLPEMTEEEWDRVISINLKGCFVCTLLVARQMIKQKRGGKIINISSIAADTTYAGQLAYVASKGGVNSLTRAAAIDLAPYHINVNAIAPGSTDTPMLRTEKEELEKRRAKIPLGKLAKPEDIAATALFLASEDSDHLTGSIIVVDGGEVINRTYD